MVAATDHCKQEPENGTGLFSNNAEYIAITPEIGFNITDSWGINATYSTARNARLIFASPVYLVGVFFTPQ